jgi:acetyl esterase/lipase
MRRKWIAGSWILLIATSCSALFGHSRTAAAMQAAVSATRVDDVPRIKLYDTTPDVVAGRETELDPTEPTLDLYIPPSDRATGAGVLILPGGGYQMLTVPGEGADPARFAIRP